MQLGAEDFGRTIPVSECAEWHYEPDFSELPERDFEVVILDREVTAEEFEYLTRFSRAYSLFLTETLLLKKDGLTHQLYVRKMGRRISYEALKRLLTDELPDYFPGSYGEKYQPQNMSVAQGFQGRVAWRGYEGLDLDGEYGDELTQIVFWRNNIPLFEKQALEFWLEYSRDDTVEISLEITVIQYGYGTVPECQNVWTFSEKDLEEIVYIENTTERIGYVFSSIKAKGHGRLTVTALHDRHSRRGKGNFIPGGGRMVTSEREEVFYYFDPGNLKPPLNVYFSGYKTQEGFEGYYMMRKMRHPFLLISEARLEGGCFYIGSEEYEDMIEQIIRRCMGSLGFKGSEVILSGLSMGTFGALYYGCRIHPNTILMGKPLASLGDVAENKRINCPDESHSWVDVLHKICGSQDQDAIKRLNDRFWNLFDRTDWSGTRFAAAYMIEDDLDGNAYEYLQNHIRDAGVRIYGKGLHGRHNDNTPGIVDWFVNQYRAIIWNDFDRMRSETGGEEQ